MNTSTNIVDPEALAVSPDEAARMLRCSRPYLYRLLDKGEFQTFMLGQARRITVDSIKAYIARRIAAGGSRPSPNPRTKR